jgi:DNA polymerase-1
MYGLPFKEIIALDFEFHGEGLFRSGARPVPVCLVAKSLVTGRVWRLWQDELGPAPPFPVDDDTLFIAFYSSAEWGCFLSLGWPLPQCVFDPFVEFRRETNGMVRDELFKGKQDLLHALSYHGIYTITSAQKHAERELVLRGGPWTLEERARILAYCETDVDPLAALLERMLAALTLRPKGLRQALLRGRYMVAVACMEYAGVPLDMPTLSRLRAHWDDIKLKLIAEIDADYGVYEGTTFRTGLFASYLVRNRMDWPRTETGRLSLEHDTFKAMEPRYPHVRPLMDLRHALGEMRLESLAAGPDGRNRTLLSPFGARTGRNTPSNTEFIFGPAVWLRSLIRPGEGRSLAYVDWSSQEIAVAAVLSQEQALLDAIAAGVDPYMAFARMAGLAPPDATKVSHPHVREMCKTCMLGICYGMGKGLLSVRTGLDVHQTARLLAKVRRTFPTLCEWSDSAVSGADLRGYSSTVFGWPLLTSKNLRTTTQKNFPVQANAAEMLRLACCFATERGVQVCAPVHDALLIEADSDRLDEALATARAAMAEASGIVLRGLVIGTDVNRTTWPGRYVDAKERGEVMWGRVTGILDGMPPMGSMPLTT